MTRAKAKPTGPDPPTVEWIVYRTRGTKRTRFGWMYAATAEEAVAHYREMLPMAKDWTLTAERRR